MKKLVFTALFFIVVLWAVVVFAPQLVLPGAMTPGHGELAQDCFTCHSPFSGPSRQKCLNSHEPNTINSEKTGGPAFHNRLARVNCRECHTNHQGHYGQQHPGQFTHDLLDKAVLNDCVACHAAPKDVLHAGLKSRCSSCHGTESWLPAKFIHSELVKTTDVSCRDCHKPPENKIHTRSNGDCGQCHSVRSWQPADFDHDRYFRFDKDHETGCSTCHPDNGFDTYTCYGCHEHSSRKLEKEHREEGIRDFQSCADCHRSGDEHEAKYGDGFRRRYRGESDDHEIHDDHGSEREGKAGHRKQKHRHDD